MHMMSIFCLAVDAESLSSRFIVFNVLRLKVTMLVILLYVSKFGLDSLADFFNTGARVLTSAECTHCLLVWKSMQFRHIVWIRVMVIFQWLSFLIKRHYPYRWIALVSWLNYLNLVVIQWCFSTQHLVKQGIDLALNSSTLPHIHHATSHGFNCNMLVWLIKYSLLSENKKCCWKHIR